MEVRFENRYVGTGRMAFEYAFKILSARAIRSGFLFAPFFLISFALLLRYENLSGLLLAGALGLYVLISVALTPFRMFRRLKASSASFQNGRPYENVVRFGEYIQVSEGAVSMTVAYAQIRSFRRLRHSWVLMFGKTNAILLSPIGFTEGDANQFEDFIREMCPNLTEVCP